MTKGMDNFPKTMADTIRLISNYKVSPRLQRAQPGGNSGVAFVQGGSGAKKPAGTATPIAEVVCWHCAQTGHYKSNCLLLKEIDQQHGMQNFLTEECNEGHNLFSANDGWTLVQKGKKGVQGILFPYHVFINTCASYVSTPHKSFLKNLRLQEHGLVGHSNAGSCGMDEAGTMGAIKKMWYNKGGIATIVPLKVLERIFPILYQSHKGMNPGHFVIHSDQGDIIVKNSGIDMPYLDVRELKAEVTLRFVQTVMDNLEGYTAREIEDVPAAQAAQAMLGHPMGRDFLGMVHANLIDNCPVTKSAVINANQIFGPDLAGVRGQTVRRPPESVMTNYVQIPWAILEQHWVVTLTVDVMFVNGVSFLVSASRGISLITAEYTPSCTAKLLADGIKCIIDLYSWGGYQVGTVLMDNESKKLISLVPIIQINTTAAKEHVPEIERRICLIKERGRGILNTLPFKKMPRLILIKLIYHVVLWLDAFPLKSGVSANLSPRELMIRHKLNFAKHCRAQFGSYCKVHEELVPTNSMITRTTPAIVLGPTGNLQGMYKFFNPETGKKIKWHEFTLYLMPDSVIRRVENYGNNNELPGIFGFANRSGVLFEWNEEVDECPEGILEEEDVILYPLLAAELLGVVLG